MTLSTSLSSLSSVLEAVRAVANWRALLLTGATLLASALVFGLLAITGSPLLAMLGWLAGVVILFYGANAVGIMLMDACRMGVPAAPGDAIQRSLATSHRALGVALAALAGLLAVVVLVALLLLLCKIPLLGPLLYTVVLPLSAVALGGAVLALLYVCLPLAACAIWTGASVGQAVTNLVSILRRRLVPVVLQECVLLLVAMLASSIIGVVLLTGLSMTSTLSLGILGPGGMMSMSPHNMMGLGAGNSYALAGLVGSLLLLAAAALVPSLILVQGFCQIYLGATDALASELPGATPGDDTLNTAARLRAAEEAAQAQRAREAAAQAAAGADAAANAAIAATADAVTNVPADVPADAREEPSAAAAAEPGSGPGADPGPGADAGAAQPAGEGAPAAEPVAASHSAAGPVASPAPEGQQSLGFGDDTLQSGGAPQPGVQEPGPERGDPR